MSFLFSKQTSTYALVVFLHTIVSIVRPAECSSSPCIHWMCSESILSMLLKNPDTELQKVLSPPQKIAEKTCGMFYPTMWLRFNGTAWKKYNCWTKPAHYFVLPANPGTCVLQRHNGIHYHWGTGELSLKSAFFGYNSWVNGKIFSIFDIKG